MSQFTSQRELTLPTTETTRAIMNALELTAINRPHFSIQSALGESAVASYATSNDGTEYFTVSIRGERDDPLTVSRDIIVRPNTNLAKSILGYHDMRRIVDSIDGAVLQRSEVVLTNVSGAIQIADLGPLSSEWNSDRRPFQIVQVVLGDAKSIMHYALEFAQGTATTDDLVLLASAYRKLSPNDRVNPTLIAELFKAIGLENGDIRVSKVQLEPSSESFRDLLCEHRVQLIEERQGNLGTLQSLANDRSFQWTLPVSAHTHKWFMDPAIDFQTVLHTSSSPVISVAQKTHARSGAASSRLPVVDELPSSRSFANLTII